MTGHSRSRRGIALIDAMVGGVLLGIGVAVVLSIASRALAAQADGERRLAAAWLADEALNLVLVEGPEVFKQLYDTSGRFDEPFEIYAYDIEIENNGPGQPYTVTVIVKWMNGRHDRNLSVQTMIAERQGEEEQPRAPVDPVDREDRWYDEDEFS
jgi:hypothetical protein